MVKNASLRERVVCVCVLGGGFSSSDFSSSFFGGLGPSPLAYRDSQAAAGHSHSHSHSNPRFEPHLQPTSQLTATWDP